MQDSTWIFFKEFSSETEALIAKEMLEHHGIKSIISSPLGGYLDNSSGPIKILVQKDDLAKAQAVLK